VKKHIKKEHSVEYKRQKKWDKSKNCDGGQGEKK